ncbi:hypothetical protein ACMY46_06235 [Bartonella bacilliformis]|uniref:hypothetical protein n=1 Tax=Bartonella bacilliformis TaxID=774 RepID=UPI0004A02FE0|nr:hypothetical protein [Bartonella bacilliformis]KEG17062.1 hypothetical protein H705_00955 [Bartonella bacilliformis Cond044]
MKPAYHGSKRYLWWSFWLSWMVVFLLIAGGLWGVPRIVDMADIAIPSMVAIIIGNLGVHRGFGSLDFLSIKRSNIRNSQKQSVMAAYRQENKRDV